MPVTPSSVVHSHPLAPHSHHSHSPFSPPVSSMTFIGDSERYLAIGLVDGRVHVWDVRDGVLVRVLRGHTQVPWFLHALRLMPAAQPQATKATNAPPPAPAYPGHRDLFGRLGGPREGDAEATRLPDAALVTGGRDGALRLWSLGGSRPDPPARSQVQIISDAGGAGVVRKALCVRRAHRGAVLAVEPLNLADVTDADGWVELATAHVREAVGRGLARNAAKREAERRAREAGAGAAGVAGPAGAAGAAGVEGQGHGQGAAAGAGEGAGGGGEEGGEEGWQSGREVWGDGAPFPPGRLPEGVVASGGSDSVVKLWDMQTWECVAEMRGHRHGCLSLAFSLPQRPQVRGGLGCMGGWRCIGGWRCMGGWRCICGWQWLARGHRVWLPHRSYLPLTPDSRCHSEWCDLSLSRQQLQRV